MPSPSASGGELVSAQGQGQAQAPIEGELILPLHYLPPGAGATQCGKPAVNLRATQSGGWFRVERKYGWTCADCRG